MSKGRFSSLRDRGLELARAPSRARRAAASGSAPPQLDGRYDRYARAPSSASSSVLHSTSPQPDTEQCMRAPPISSSVVFSPITISAMRGEPRYIDAVPSTMNTRSQNAGMYAPPAAEGPNKQQICGIRPDILT